jgi:hypothetical protein
MMNEYETSSELFKCLTLKIIDRITITNVCENFLSETHRCTIITKYYYFLLAQKTERFLVLQFFSLDNTLSVQTDSTPFYHAQPTWS